MTRPLLAWIALGLAHLSAQATPAPAAETFVVEGRVVDMRGEGVPAAKVHVSTWQAPDVALAETVADGEGYFRLGKVPKGPGLVHARAEGFCIGAQYVGRAVRIDLQHAVTVKGTLRNRHGEPVAGAIVRADPFGRSLTYVHCDARSDADGKFVLTAVPFAPVTFTAWVEGEGLARVQQPVRGDCEIALAPNEEKTTRIEVSVSGLPSGSAPVALQLLPYRSGGLSELPPPHDRPQLDGQGHWSLDQAPDCDYTVYPSSQRFAFTPREVRVQAGKGPHQLAFVAAELGSTSLSCRAIVVGPDDKPVAGLRFEMRAPNGGNVANATSGEDGALTFASPLAAGVDAVLYTTHEQWVVDPPKSAESSADRRTSTWYRTKVDPGQVMALRVVSACSVHGRLLTANGSPAALAEVVLEEGSPTRWPKWMAMSRATTGRDGAFHVVGCHHLPDDVRIKVAGPTGWYTSEPFAITEPGTVQQLGELRMSPPALIEGIVRDAQSRPVPGLRVWLRDWDFDKNNQASGSVTETLTDREGRYRFTGVPPGGAWLQLLPGVDERTGISKAAEPFEVVAGKTYTIDLQAPGN